MQDRLFDMGYEVFAQRRELHYSLAYAIADGLCRCAQKRVLCDFSNNAACYTGSELLSASILLSRELRRLVGNSGRVGVVIPPSYLANVCNYACVFAGLTPVNLNFTLGKSAAQSCFKTAGIRYVLSSADIAAKISKANPNFPWAENFIDAAQFLASAPRSDFDAVADSASRGSDFFVEKYGIEKTSDPLAEGTLIFTSGSEGDPKAAVLTQRNIIANCLQSHVSKLFDDESDIMLGNLPVFYRFGLIFEVWYLAIFGLEIVMQNSPLDIKNNIRAIRERKATAIIATPTFLRAYMKHASAEDLSSLRKVIAGAEKTPAAFEELWNKKFGRSYCEGYGLTEASPIVGVNLPNADYGYFSTGTRKGSIGKLYVGMQARILSPETLTPMPFGERGLLALRGPNVFAGYLNNPSATAKALHGDWLVTGDLSRIDSEGFIFIEGRLSRFSKIGGEMVPHTTVEAVLNAELGFAGSDVPKIAISSRIDEGKGEALVLLSTVELSLAAAKDALRRAGISNLWHPKYMVLVDEIPHLASGKLDLKKMAELAK